jgi:CDP-Glycerol:Poly(glycerophosphate) glycerophosphotransferase
MSQFAPKPPPNIAMMFVGGMHQALHIAPVAVALQSVANVMAYVLTVDDKAALLALIHDLGGSPIHCTVMHAPSLLERVLSRRRLKPVAKVVRLILWNRKVRRHDAILAAERTSTLLRQLPGRCPPMIHIPHGAGDRAKGFEPRLKLFDHIIVAGPKDRRRMIAEGLVKPEHCTVSGAIKVAAVRQLRGTNPPQLFDNERPIILYNPHFRDALASWDDFAAPLIDAVIAGGRYNLIVAPHIRRFESASDSEKSAWQARAVPDQVIVDLDSPRLSDMTYTVATHIYIGDVSSQIYEFLTDSRPCIFINAHNAAWRGNPNYAMWAFGPVCNTINAVMHEIDRAGERHGDYIAVQRAAISDALGDSGERAATIAAAQVIAAMEGLNAE